MKPPPNLETKPSSTYTEDWLNQGQVDRVIARCQEALESDPDCAPAYKVLGNIYAAKGELDRAVEWYEKSLEKQPDRAEVYANLGSIFARKQQFKLAGAYYRKAIVLDPKLFIAHVNLAKIWQRLGKEPEALECLYRAGQLQPDRFDAEHHLNVGNQLLEQHQLDPAIACYHLAIEQNPQLSEAYQNLAEALVRQGNPDEANRYYRRATELRVVQTPKPQQGEEERRETETPREEAGDACVARGDLDGAVLAYRQALELTPRRWELYHKLGDVLQAGGKLHEALEAYNRATALVTEQLPSE